MRSRPDDIDIAVHVAEDEGLHVVVTLVHCRRAKSGRGGHGRRRYRFRPGQRVQFMEIVAAHPDVPKHYQARFGVVERVGTPEPGRDYIVRFADTGELSEWVPDAWLRADG